MDRPPDLAAIPSCSLEAAERAAAVRSLLRPALGGLRRRGDTVVMDLALDAGGRRRLAELLRLERECCPFWLAAVEPAADGSVRLSVRAPAPHEPALEAFVALARRAAV